MGSTRSPTDREEKREGNPDRPRRDSESAMLESMTHNGFQNLVAALAVGWIFQHLWKNYQDTGKPIDLELAHWILDQFPSMFTFWLGMILFSMSIVVCQILRGRIFEPLRIFLYSTIQLILFVAPVYFIRTHRPEMSIVLKAALMMQTCVISMKMHSYFMTYHNAWLDYQNPNRVLPNGTSAHDRSGQSSSSTPTVKTDEKPKPPRKPSFNDFFLFLCYPTLVFDFHFPRVQRVRYWYVAREWFAAFLCFLLMYLMMQTKMIPVFQMSPNISLWESVVQLMVPTLILWVVCFFGVLHCLLNGVAELSRFANRSHFYHDWWNSKTMDEFWRKWNRSVYQWMSKHIYVESMRTLKFMPKGVAAMGTFFVTALLHEYVLANAFGFIRPYLFIIIFGQIPIIYATRHPIFQRIDRVGNLLMWFSFLGGMPLVSVLYGREYYIRMQSYEAAESAVATAAAAAAMAAAI